MGFLRPQCAGKSGSIPGRHVGGGWAQLCLGPEGSIPVVLPESSEEAGGQLDDIRLIVVTGSTGS